MKTFLFFCFVLIFSQLNAQKGLPPKPVVSIQHSTNYAQHVDFQPSMISQLKVGDGYKVQVAATGLGKPRMMVFGPSGALYITRRDAADVLMLKDSNNDMVFDELKTVIVEFKGVHGIAIREGWLYACNNRELKRYRIQTDGMVGEPELLIDDLPDGGQHPNRTMHFGPDGFLYLSVGSTCNDCSESNKENATMLRINPTGWKREIFARGLRNTIGFDWHPETNELWGMDHGSDAKGDDIPPEELNMIGEDKDYGWPLIYGKQIPDETREEPVGSTKVEYAKKTEPSVMDFPAHSAPLDFRFLDKTTAIVTWHGSWNKKQPDGFKVQQVKFSNGKPTQAVDLLSGFLNSDRRSRFGRPCGIAINNGTIYISDDANGVIYCLKK